MTTNKRINVRVGELTRPLRTFRISSNTPLETFLEKIKVKYSSAVRVNARVAKKTSILKEGDIITVTEPIAGG